MSKEFNFNKHTISHISIKDIDNTMIDEAIEILSNAKEEIFLKNPNAFNLRVYTNNDSLSSPYITYVRDFTEEEIEKRELLFLAVEKREYAKYLELKEKFENNKESNGC
jgi:hypothetical protein